MVGYLLVPEELDSPTGLALDKCAAAANSMKMVIGSTLCKMDLGVVSTVPTTHTDQLDNDPN